MSKDVRRGVDNHMLALSLQTPRESLHDLTARVREHRLRLNWTQEELARRADIALPTYRRFEQTGQISLKRFVRIVHVLFLTHELEELLLKPPPRTLADLERKPTRKRGTSKRAKT